MPILPLLLLVLLSQPTPSRPASPEARELTPDTYLLPGAMLPDRGPDGNTVLLVARSGLIVIDTGRHPWHSDAILDFARSRKLLIAAIVNTHWHLDHSSGNARIKAAHPGAKVYTTSAVERALAPGGFLARNLAAARNRPPEANPLRAEETQLFISTMDKADALRADVTVSTSGPLTLAGRTLTTHVAFDAVTDADLWLYDEATGVAVIGDLVTLPAPFFETACPARWQAALDEVWATPFRIAVPGHGAPMSRAEFDQYRQAFGSFRACVASENPAGTCSAAWTKDLGALLTSENDRKQATEYANYYVDFLRKNKGASPDCRVK